MSDTKDIRPQFFSEVHDLALANDVVAYVIVGVVKNENGFSIASGAGSRLNDETNTAKQLYGLVEKAFTHALGTLTAPENPPKGGMLN